VDIMATCLDVAGASYPRELGGQTIKPLEGCSLVPLFSALPHLPSPRLLYWEHEGNRAIRDGRWKLVAKENRPWELYDIDADRSELHDLASAEPERVKTMSANWDAWAARADVLPLGGWRGKKSDTGLSRATRFTLKAGDHLDRSEAPAIAQRAFTLTAKFDTRTAKDGVIVAQGGTANGYALFLADGKLHFMVRSSAGVATTSTPAAVAGAHTATARLDSQGTLTLAVDGQPAATASTRGPIAVMPAEGLDVGSDERGAVGPYSAPNAFAGSIESIIIELGPR
jgi:hypothetical protein